jgi:uncharacterized protein (DUF1684 family)
MRLMNRKTRATRRAGLAIPAFALLLAAGGGAGCRTAEPGSMVRLAPPRNWEELLGRFRQAREDYVRGLAETPPQEDASAAFEGPHYWPSDPDLYFVGPVHVYSHPDRLTIVTTAGQARPGERLGWIAFPIGGRVHTLQVYRLLDQPEPGAAQDLFLGFYDETTGEESYPAGRYVDLRGDGPYVLDFNRAYNPSCAYGSPERFTCPRVPAENRLPVRIEAGERGYPSPGAKGE